MTNIPQALLTRRGFKLGSVDPNQAQTSPHSTTDQQSNLTRWAAGQPVLLSGICKAELEPHQTDLGAAEQLYVAILEEQECGELLAQTPYAERLASEFESLGSSINEGDDQEIETLVFDALDNDELVAEDLWMKVSWLSFYEEDASLRFRFSFGIDHEEDVAADHVRQHHAAELTDAIFPESRVITQNQRLNDQLTALLSSDSVRFVERIIYFNSPNGGAYLHHDRERGHAGVVYAQLSGATFWLALPKHKLVSEISGFIEYCETSDHWPTSMTSQMQTQLVALNKEPNAIADQLDTFSNNTLIHLINETEAFVQLLIRHGHGWFVQAGDALLLPQEAANNCCWHSVFNLGEESGQALSFAIRTA